MESKTRTAPFNPKDNSSFVAAPKRARATEQAAMGDENGVRIEVADGDGAETPLLRPKGVAGTASPTQTFGNIIVSIVGTGVLGLPFAFRVAGWLGGSVGVIFAGISTFYCMLLLIECREKVEEAEAEESTQIRTYGDLGGRAFGATGRFATEFVVLISQCGGAVAYLVFIGQNLSSIFKSHSLPFSASIFLLVPVEIALSFIRSLSALAPFSALADVCNVLAIAVVVKADLQVFDGMSGRKAVASLGGMAFAGGVAVFCFEGFSMTLALEGSMRERRRFRKVLGLAFVAITSVYLCFGAAGYLAYGEETRDIITLNLPSDWSAIVVKVGLCVALTFALPIMIHPVNEIVEAKVKASAWFRKLCKCKCKCKSKRDACNCNPCCCGTDQAEPGCSTSSSRSGAPFLILHLFRAASVLFLAIFASFVPAFGALVSLVGSTFCALLSFVLPAMFHLALASPSFPQATLDRSIFLFGLAFACYGTYTALSPTP